MPRRAAPLALSPPSPSLSLTALCINDEVLPNLKLSFSAGQAPARPPVYVERATRCSPSRSLLFLGYFQPLAENYSTRCFNIQPRSKLTFTAADLRSPLQPSRHRNARSNCARLASAIRDLDKEEERYRCTRQRGESLSCGILPDEKPV